MKRLLLALLAVLVVAAAWGASGQGEETREPHDPIRIVGDDGFESCTCVRGGNGTAEDPYRIANWRIDLTPYRHQLEINRTEESAQSAEPHTLVGVNFRNTTAHVVVENVHVVDEGPSKPEGRYQEETVGLKAINASNIHVRDVAVRGTWAAYSFDPGPVRNITFEDTTFRSRFLSETDTQYLVGSVVETQGERAPHEFADLYDEYLRGYFPYGYVQDNLTYRNVTADIGLYDAHDDSLNLFDWGIGGTNLTVDNVTITKAGQQVLTGSIFFDGNATIKNLDVESSVGFYCYTGLCADVSIRNLDAGRHVSLRSPGGNAFFRPDDLQSEVTRVRNVTADGGLSLEGTYGLHNASLGSFLFFPPDEGRWRDDIEPVPAYPVENVTTDGYTNATSTDGYNALRTDVPLRAKNLHLEPGVEIRDSYDMDGPTPVFENSTAGGLPIVSLLAGEGPHRVEQPVAAATVESGAVVEKLEVRGQNDEVVPWITVGFNQPHATGVFLPQEDTTLRNVTVEAAAIHALPLEGGVHAENVTIVGKDLRDEAFRYSTEDALYIAVDALEGPNRLEDLTIEGVPAWTAGVRARNPAHATTGTEWRIEDVGAGIVRNCFRGTDICRHIDAQDVRIDATYAGLLDVMPLFGIEAPHLPSEGPMEIEDGDLSAPYPAAVGFGGSLDDVNLDRTHPEGYHIVVSQWTELTVDGAWADTGLPRTICGNCPFTSAMDHIDLTNLQVQPFNEAPQLAIDRPAMPVRPGTVTLEATASDDWDETDPIAWTRDGDRVGEGSTVSLSLTHGVHPVTGTVEDHRGAVTEETEDVLVKASKRPLAYVHPVASPAPHETVEVTGEGYGNVTSLTWDVGADGTVDGNGSTIDVTFDQRFLPIELTAEAGDGDQHAHTRVVAARDEPPTPAIDAPDEVTAGQTTTVEAVGGDDWGIADRTWTLLPQDEQASGSTFTFTPTSPGPLPLRLATEDTGGQIAKTAAAIQVEAAPVALDVTLSPMAPTTRDTVELTATNGAEWAWDVGNDTTIESTAPQLRWRFHTPGTYDVNVSALVDGERVNRTIELSVTDPPPEASFAVEPGPAGSVELTATVADEGWTSLRWDVDGDGDTEFTGPTATWVPAEGTHTVTLTAIDDDGARTTVERTLAAPTPDPGLELDPLTSTATAPYTTTVSASLPVPVRADSWRADLDGDTGIDRNGTLPMPTSFTAHVNDTGPTNVSLELLGNGTVIAEANSTLEGLAPGETPPALTVEAEGPGPGHVVGEPLTVTVEAEDPDGLTNGTACTSECRALGLAGTADTDTVDLPTPTPGTALTITVEDVHGATNRTTRSLDARPGETPTLTVPKVTTPALQPFSVPVNATDPEERPVDVAWRTAERAGRGSPGPFRLPSGTHNVTVTAEDPSGMATTTRKTVLVDEIHQAKLALADRNPRTGDELTFLSVVDDSHGPAHAVEGELTLTWRPAGPLGIGIPLGTWTIDEPREIVETGVRERPGTIVANLTVDAGPSPSDPVPTRDRVSVELAVDGDGPPVARAQAIPTESAVEWPPAVPSSDPAGSLPTPQIQDGDATALARTIAARTPT